MGYAVILLVMCLCSLEPCFFREYGGCSYLAERKNGAIEYVFVRSYFGP